MVTREYSIEVDRPREKLFSVLSKISNWPEIFPACEAINIIDEKDNKVVFEIHAVNKTGKMSWKTESVIQPNDFTITSKQLESGNNKLKMMHTYWKLESIDENKTLVKFTRKFNSKVKTPIVKGLVERRLILRKIMEPVIREDLNALTNIDEKLYLSSN